MNDPVAEQALRAIDYYDQNADLYDQEVESHLALNRFLIHYLASMRNVTPASIAERLRTTSYTASTKGSDQPFLVPAPPILLGLDRFEGAPDSFDADGHRLFAAARDLNRTLLAICSQTMRVTYDHAFQAVRQDLNRITRETP